MNQLVKKISVVIPCYNEALGIYDFIDKLALIIDNLQSYLLEVVFVDDGSADNTFEILKKESAKYHWINVLSLTRNFGKEAALTAGLDFATGDAIVFMDADLQHPPALIQEFVLCWERGEHVVVGRRISRDTDSWAYKLLAQSFYALNNRISDVKLPLNVGDFRLIDKKVADQLRQLKESRRFMKGLFAWVGYQPRYVDYIVADRVHGRSSFNKWRSWNFALEGITSFSTAPLRVWSYVGVIVLFFGLLYSLIIIVDAFFNGVKTPGYVTLLTAMVIFGGVQLIGIGVLGEYIGRIYMEVKNRPSYLIGKVVKSNQEKIK